MHLRCQACGASIQADDINIHKAIAKCRTCHAVMSFADQLAHGPDREGVECSSR